MHQYLAIWILRNATRGGVSNFPEKISQTCTVQCYWHYEGLSGCKISLKKALRNTWMAPNVAAASWSSRSGVAKGGAGGANAPPQIFVVPLLQKTL